MPHALQDASQASALEQAVCVSLCSAGTVDVILSYCHYCLNDTALQDQLPYFQEKQVSDHPQLVV